MLALHFCYGNRQIRTRDLHNRNAWIGTTCASSWSWHAPIRSREDLRGHTFISYDDDLLFSKELQYLDELYKPDSFALRSTSILAQHQATAAGAGIAVLPAFIAERDKSLRRVLPHEANFMRTFWMSVPAETRHLARMKAVWDFLRATVEAQRDVLLPPGPEA